MNDLPVPCKRHFDFFRKFLKIFATHGALLVYSTGAFEAVLRSHHGPTFNFVSDPEHMDAEADPDPTLYLMDANLRPLAY